MRRLLIGCAVGVLLSTTNCAPSSARSVPLGQIAQRAFDTGVTPGMAVAVVRDGKIIFEGGYGVADVGKKTAVTAETPFAIGSMTKQFTAVSILMLAQEGKLSLDDPLSKYLPQLPNAKQITLRELLWQTSGLHTYPNTHEHPWPLTGEIAPGLLFSIMATDKPDFAPGTKWEYSNTNYAVLADVVARVSGVSYDTFLASHIFGPVGMKQSGYGYAAQRSLPMPTAYQGRPFAPYPQTLSLDLYYGAGAIVASAHDVALWERALLHGALLNADGMHDLWSAGHLADGTPNTYAMGFMTAVLNGHREVWHNGWAPGSGGYCYSAIFPDDGIAVVTLTNEDPSIVGAMPDILTNQLFEALVPPPSVSAAAGEDPAITAVAKSYFASMGNGTVDTSKLAPEFAKLFTPTFDAQLVAGITSLGTPTSWTFIGKTVNGETTLYRYSVGFPAGTHTFIIAITSDGKIAGSRLL